MLSITDLSIFDYQLIFTTILFIFLGIAHEWFGIRAYTEGSSINVFRVNSSWIPESSKEKTLLGVFFMISFAWWQGHILLILIILVGNPLNYLLGIVALLFNIPQLILLRKYVRWNKIAQSVGLLHIISIVIWLIPYLND